jgi:hypothetical protein
MDTQDMADTPSLSPSEKRMARDAARKGGRVRRTAIKQAMQAGWAGEDADEANWLNVAARATLARTQRFTSYTGWRCDWLIASPR